MKKNKKIKILAAERGAWLGGNLQLNKDISTGAQLGGLAGATVQAFSNEGGDTADFAGSAISGIGTGAAAGAAFGPAGAIAGGAIGLVGGLFGASKRRKQERARKRAEQAARVNQGSLTATNNVRSDFYDEYAQTALLQDGGQVNKTTPVYLNDGETVVRPDGTVRRIPKKGRPTDSVLTEEEVGSFVFGGVIDPDTKESYADMAERMFKPSRKSSNEGIYAENTKKLNKLNALLLFAKQEQTKVEQGIKPKYKQMVLAASTGDWLKPYWQQIPVYDHTYTGTGQTDTSASGVLKPAETSVPNTTWGSRRFSNMDEFNQMYPDSYEDEYGNRHNVDESDDTITHVPEIPTVDVVAPSVKPRGDEAGKAKDIRYSSTPLENMLALSPVAYNFIQGLKTPEYELPHLNLNTPTALSQVRNRFNLIGGKNALRDAANTGYYNVNTTGNVTGANMAQRAAITLGTQRANVDLYDKYNTAATQAGNARADILMNTGQQDAAARKYAADVNARNRANTRNFTRAGFEGLSKYAQNRQRMRYQLNRDEMLMPFYREYLKHGINNEIVDMLNA